MIAREEIRLLEGLQPGTSVLLQGLFDGGQEDSFINRLRKEVDCTALHCFDCGGDITASGYENDRNRYLRRNDSLNFQSAHPRHLEVENKTGCSIVSFQVQEFRAGREQSNILAIRSQQ